MSSICGHGVGLLGARFAGVRTETGRVLHFDIAVGGLCVCPMVVNPHPAQESSDRGEGGEQGQQGDEARRGRRGLLASLLLFRKDIEYGQVTHQTRHAAGNRPGAVLCLVLVMRRQEARVHGVIRLI
jgi:hypothetical protein